MSEIQKKEVFRLLNVSVKKSDVYLLKNLNLTIFSGELLGILSLDNLGVSMLSTLISRNIPIDYGSVYLNGSLINNYLYSNKELTGVGIIGNNNNLVDDLSVIDNIYVLSSGFSKSVISKKMEKQYIAEFKEITRKMKISLSPYDIVKDLSIFDKCIVSLIKSLLSGSKLIICEYLSNFLSTTDLVKFHKMIDSLKNQGISFIYMCIHHEEAFAICDSLAIMENGSIIKKMQKKHFNDDAIAIYTNEHYQKTRDDYKSNMNFLLQDNPSIKVEGKNVLTNNFKFSFENDLVLSFYVKKGNCITILDNDGEIISKLPEIISENSKEGKYNKDKREISFISENPTQNQLFYDFSYIDNLCFLKGNSFPKVWRNKRFKKSIVSEFYPILGNEMKTSDINSAPIASLYNIVYYRQLIQNTEVLFIFQPFSGADMMLRNHIIELITVLKEKGIAVVLVTLNLSDCLKVSENLIVIERNGQKTLYNKEDFGYISKNRLDFSEKDKKR